MNKYLPLMLLLVVGCNPTPSNSEIQKYWDAHCKDQLQKTDTVLSTELVEEYIDKETDVSDVRPECRSQFNIPTKVYKAQFNQGPLIFEKQNDKIFRHMTVKVYLEERNNRREIVELRKQRAQWPSKLVFPN